jgi:hypothetical protein
MGLGVTQMLIMTMVISAAKDTHSCRPKAGATAIDALLSLCVEEA